jgi:hypothetical protein
MKKSKQKIFSLDDVARQIAEIINENRGKKEPIDLLTNATKVFFNKYDDDIHGELRLVMQKTMGGGFDPLVAYTPLVHVLGDFESLIKKYNFRILDEDDYGKIAIRKYLLDEVWHKANPSKDEFMNEASPHMREDYADIDKWYGGTMQVIGYVLYDIELRIIKYLMNKKEEGFTVDQILEINSKTIYELPYEDWDCVLKNLTKEFVEVVFNGTVNLQVH